MIMNKNDDFMDREQKIARHYLETGVLGAYETAAVVPVCLNRRRLNLKWQIRNTAFFTAGSVRRTS
ncbi:MAG: hypothetical protein H6Q60_817 [Oscillospiraceae bacterium]|nr:hypothetical protein [Oscillospiraceae bacterium]